MDLLAVPSASTLPVSKAPYVCTEHWDGGKYLDYAARKGRMSTLHPSLRRLVTSGAAQTGDDWLEPIHPTPQADQQAFFQTWFFFGLLAEFLGLNEADDGTRQIDEKQAEEEIESLYEGFFVTDEEDRRFISGGKLLEPGWGSHLMGRVRQTRQGIAHRAKYLHGCLQFTCTMLHTAIHTDFDRDVLYSIGALGELFCTSFVTAANLGLLPMGLPHFGLPWQQNYLKPRGELEKHMLENGWCKSEVEKLRWVYQGLGTQHFLSRMKKDEPHRDHTRCSADGCVAFQLDETYRPLHATAGCTCAFVGREHVDTVQRILKTTNGYPVLRVDMVEDPAGVDEPRPEVTVEEHSDGVPYVAISHVWADGMGNPKENSLPQCQITKVAGLVADLEKRAGTAVDATTPAYRFWIDPLLCPIEKVGNAISLGRIKDVYRNARHVLVLDASIMRYRFESLGAAEALLRMFATSAWMRRLWTLQEGALAQTLLFQFADKAVTSQEALEQLFRHGLNDTRYMRIWIDVFTEATNLRGWFQPPFNHANPKSPEILISLQRTLHFRTVSVPADEPICIATLLSFNQQDQENIIAASKRDGHDAAVARVWEVIAQSLFNGRLPAAMLFSADATLEVPGWRWAPRSLLGANAGAAEGVMDLNTRMMRFHLPQQDIPTNPPETETETEQQPESPTTASAQNNSASATTPATITTDSSERRTSTAPRPRLGIPTPLGLRVQLPGFLLHASPLLPHLPLHPWEGTFTPPSEDFIFVRQPATGQWLRVMDLHRARRSGLEVDDDEKIKRGDGASPPPPPPLTESIRSGNCAILYDPDVAAQGGILYCLMVQKLEPRSQGSGAEEGGLRVRRDRMVLVDVASAGYALLAETLRELAVEVAAHDATGRLLEVVEGGVGGEEERKEAVEGVRRVMKEVMAGKCASEPAFARAVGDCIGFGLEQFMWAQIPVRFSHDVVADVCSETQIWVVD